MSKLISGACFFSYGVFSIIKATPRFCMSLISGAARLFYGLIKYAILFSFPFFFIKALNNESSKLNGFEAMLTPVALILCWQLTMVLMALDSIRFLPNINPMMIYSFSVTAQVLLFIVYCVVHKIMKKGKRDYRHKKEFRNKHAN